MSKPAKRDTRPLPFWFEQFPENKLCPVCLTNDQGATVLIPIDGTSDGSISQATPVHLTCAIPKHHYRELKILYRRCQE